MTKLAIFGGKPIRTKPFPEWPRATQQEKDNLQKVINSNGWGFFRTDLINEFAQKFAGYHGARYGITCSNATIALQLQLMALGIGRGDEVITTVFMPIPTVTAITSVGAIPIFVDINSDDYCMNVDLIESRITSRTKAIMPVHIYSALCDLDRLVKICQKRNIHLIEDAAQVPGSFYGKKGVGTFGISGSFSFQESKVMTSGEGGIIITDNREIKELILAYANCGRRNDGDTARPVLGGNHRITAFQAAVLLGQLDLLKNRTAKRQENAEYLDRHLRDIDGIDTIHKDPKITQQAYYNYIVKIDEEKIGVRIDTIKSALLAEGIELKDPVVPIYKSPLFNINTYDSPEAYDYYLKHPIDENQYPIAEKAGYHEALCIRHAILLEEKEDMDDIIRAFKKVFSNLEVLRKMDA